MMRKELLTESMACSYPTWDNRTVWCQGDGPQNPEWSFAEEPVVTFLWYTFERLQQWSLLDFVKEVFYCYMMSGSRIWEKTGIYLMLVSLIGSTATFSFYALWDSPGDSKASDRRLNLASPDPSYSSLVLHFLFSNSVPATKHSGLVACNKGCCIFSSVDSFLASRLTIRDYKFLGVRKGLGYEKDT